MPVKEKVGIVVSNKMEKTIVVKVDSVGGWKVYFVGLKVDFVGQQTS